MRRAALLIAGFALAVLSCGPDLTSPGSHVRYARGISFTPVFPQVLAQSDEAAGALVPFNRVRVVLHHADGTVALDTVVSFPEGADSIIVSLSVQLALTAPASGEPLAMNLAYINAAGDTVFKGGPVTVDAVPSTPGVPPPPPVGIPVTYTGPGSTATGVVISPRSEIVFDGDAFSFAAVAHDASGAPLSGTPIIWASLDPAIASIAAPSAGAGTALPHRGTARIVAQLLTGPADTVTVSVLLHAATIAAVSGSGQTAVVNTPLAQPIVVKIAAIDGVGVAGIPGAFAAANGGSTVGVPVLTDANGLAQSPWTLGPTAGTQSATATAAGLSGSPVTFTATATSPPATQLVFTTQPASTVAGSNMAPFVVTARDANGATATSFTGAVTIALGNNPGVATLNGTLTVNAVAGVATFSTLSMTRAAAGYTFVASATGPASTTSAPFDILPGPAASIAAESGNGQTGNVGTALTLPFGARVLDAFSNAVPGVTVTWAVTAGGGTLSAATGTTDANGRASSTLTIGSTGTNTVTATAAGVATPATFNATGATPPPTGPGPVAQLVFLTQPSTVTAGVPFTTAPVVQAQDVNGVPVTTFTGTVTIAIGTNPGGSTLGGTLSVAAVSGNATFSNLRFNRIGAGYTIVASSSPLPPVTSAAFTVVAAPAISFFADSGNAQTAPAGTLLPQQAVARALDSLGNPVSGKTVTWAIGLGGGSFAGATVSTDANGRVRANWTLGATIGAQTLVATSVGVPGSPLTFTATGAVALANRTWTGATSTAWATASNWSPAIVPVSTDSVLIGPATNQPTVSTVVTVTHLYVQSGGVITNTNSFTATGNLVISAGGSIANAAGAIVVNGNLDATGGIVGGTGTVTVSGALAHQIKGGISATTTTITGPGLTTLTGQLTVSGDLTINGSTDVDLAGQNLVDGNGNVSTATGGTITLTNAASLLTVQTGNLTFGGGSEVGRLTTGGINFAGPQLNTSAVAFTAGPLLTFDFNGGSAQSYTGTPTFGNVILVNLAGLTGPAFSAVNVNVVTGVWTSSGAATISGQLTDATGSRLVATSLTFTGGAPVSATTPSVASPQVNFGASAILQANLSIPGNVTVTAGSLTLNSHTLRVGGTYGTTGTGTMTMTNVLDTLIVTGSASFAGGSTVGLLTNGYLEIQGATVTQSVTANAFEADAPHETHLTGTLAQTITFANPNFGTGGSHFGTLFLGDTATYINNDIHVNGQLKTGVVATHTIHSTAHVVFSGGANVSSLTFDNTRWVALGGFAFTTLDFVTFKNMSPTVSQMTFQADGNNPLPRLNNWTFLTTPTTGFYLQTFDTDGIAPFLTATMNAPVPGISGGFVLAGNNSVINWPNVATWTGAVSTDWNLAGNWDVGAVPNSSTDVVIPATTNAPSTTLSTGTSVKNMTVNTGAVVTIANGQISVNGNLTITTGGRIDLTGASAPLGQLLVFGNVVADTTGGDAVSTCAGGQGLNLQSGVHTVKGRFCNLYIFGTYTATGPIFVSGSGTTGNLNVAGAGSTLTLAGNRVAAAQLNTAASATITMTNASDSLIVSGIATFSGGSTTGLMTAGNLVIGGSVINVTGTALDATGTHTTTFNSASFQTLSWTSSVAGHGYNNVIFRNAGQKSFSGNQTIIGSVVHAPGSGHVSGSWTITIGGNVIDSTATHDAWNGSSVVILTGSPTVLPKSFGVNTLTFNGGTVSLADSLTGVGFMVVDGASAHLKLNGHKVHMTANFTTQNGGVVEMTNAADSLIVLGSTVFNGGSTAGLLSHGYINTAGFSQGGNAAAFSADSTLRLSIGQGNASQITFANPGFGSSLSHFGELMIGDGSTHTLLSNVFVEGQITTSLGVQFPITSANLLITARGANATHLYLTNTRLLLLDGSPVTTMTDVKFLSMDPTVTQFEVQRSGTAGTGDFTATLNTPTFGTIPTTGLYLKATDTDALTPFLTINVSSASPATSGGFATALSGAVVNWASAFTLVTSGSWSTAANWSPVAVPDSFNDVIIPTGKTATLAATSFAKNLTIQGSGVIAQGIFDLEVHGNLATDTTQGGFTCNSGITYQPDGGPATLQGRLCRYHSGRKITQTGLVSVDSVWHVHDSTYTFNGHKVVTKEAWIATTAGSSGSLVMTNAVDSLIVSDSLWVGDPASISAKVSTLTSGFISVGGNFRQVGNPGTGYFNPSAANQLWLSGTAKQINFADTTTSGFGSLTLNGGSRTLGTVARVAGSMFIIGSGSVTGTTGRFKVAGSLFGTTSTSITTKGFELTGVYSDTGTFSPDTAVFTGGTVPSPQNIPDTLTNGIAIGGPTFNSVRVTGIAQMIVNSANSFWNLAGDLNVTGSGQLRIGTGSSIFANVSGNLNTAGSGALQMIDASSTLHVAGNATFDGGSTSGLLTAGTIDVGGNFTESGTTTTSYAPSGGQSTVFSSAATQNVSFAHPTTSQFNHLTIFAGATAALGSDITVLGDLNHSGTLASTFSATTTRLLTTSGISNPGPYPLNFTNVQLKFVDGNLNATMNNVNFSGFPLAYAGTMFEIARTSGGPYTFTSLSFTGTLGATGRYVVNSGSQAVTLTSVSPALATVLSVCGCSTAFQATGTGSIVWP